MDKETIQKKNIGIEETLGNLSNSTCGQEDISK